MEILLDRIEDLSNRFTDDINAVIERSMVFLGRIPSDATTSSVIRQITKAEAEIAQIREDSLKAARGIREMGGPLAQLLSSLKELKKLMASSEASVAGAAAEERKEKPKAVELPDLSLDMRRDEK
jgi:hypothetical protein